MVKNIMTHDFEIQANFNLIKLSVTVICSAHAHELRLNALIFTISVYLIMK